MVNQKLISARIDHTVLWQIEQEAMLGHYTRNRILNEGARLFLDVLETRRNLACYDEPELQQKILKGFLKRWHLEV